MPSKKKLKRYHKGFYFPPWAKDSINDFLSKRMSQKSVVFSIHAVDKIVEESFHYGKYLMGFLFRSVKKTSMKFENVFEFYAYDKEIKKVCFRLSYPEFPVDLIFVISSEETVITFYTTNKGDNHDSLDKDLYEKGE